MRTTKIAAISLGALGLFALAAPSALAARHHHGHAPHVKGAKVLMGTICSYTAGASLTISSSCGTPADVTVTLNRHSRLDYEGTTAPTPAPATGDAAVASLRWHKGSAIVKRLEYSETAFAVKHEEFPGTYVSSTGDCTSGTLTIAGLGHGKKSGSSTFNTDTNTVYTSGGTASTCSVVTGAYKANERLNVRGEELTNGTWYAARVNAVA